MTSAHDADTPRSGSWKVSRQPSSHESPQEVWLCFCGGSGGFERTVVQVSVLVDGQRVEVGQVRVPRVDKVRFAGVCTSVELPNGDSGRMRLPPIRGQLATVHFFDNPLPVAKVPYCAALRAAPDHPDAASMLRGARASARTAVRKKHLLDSCRSHPCVWQPLWAALLCPHACTCAHNGSVRVLPFRGHHVSLHLLHERCGWATNYVPVVVQFLYLDARQSSEGMHWLCAACQHCLPQHNLEHAYAMLCLH